MGKPDLHGGIMAFDAATGTLQWSFSAGPYTGPNNWAKGDTEGLRDRLVHDPFHPICLPAHWSAANIDGAGFVYAARSDGFIYGVHGPSSAGPGPVALGAATSLAELAFASTPGLEVREFDADGASLHGAFAFAPGRMAVATCDTLYMFSA